MQLVVQLALLIMSLAFSNLSSLTPNTTVVAVSALVALAGALITTLLAPALMWALALSGSTKKPVDSINYIYLHIAPRQGRWVFFGQHFNRCLFTNKISIIKTDILLIISVIRIVFQ